MNVRLKLSLTGLWLITSLSAIVLPVFLPSGPRNQLIGNPIDLATASMFVLSLPSSLIALPVAAFIDSVGFRFGSSPIGDQYLFILLLFVVGVVQWFWLVPKIFRNRKALQTIELSDVNLNAGLVEASGFDINGASPVDRILQNREGVVQHRVP
ncbi:MAG TPA: hypothetical protein VJV05_06675 [Pyrinomonadaceae bacterium]|nr:hypothetical protein [Pyrinomonadaceae bacterium]